MNVRTEIRHSIPEHELYTLGLRAFQGLGLNAKNADDVVKVLLLADLFGLSTHGLSRIESYGERLDVGGIAKNPDITVERVAPALIKVDGANGVGPLVGMHGLRAAMEVARECGIGAAFVRGSNHFGPISPYSYLAAEEGFASMIGSNATTTIAPWGGSDARLGNSPLGFGVPGADGVHFMLDMAMSVVARAKIRNALKAEESIPDTWGTDKHGRKTTDPKAALDGFLQPIGGHKGYGLALLVDMFAGVLSNAAYLTHVKSWVDVPDEPQNLGHFFILIDTKRLGSSTWLVERMRDFAEILHASPAAEKGKPVIVPGEIELRNMARQRANGIDVDTAVFSLLQQRAMQPLA